LLEADEVPEIPYGLRADDRYQNTQGIARSSRKIPATIPKKNLVGSSIDKLDPAKELREAGYPFNHISTELTELHGKFEVVSNDVLLLKETIGKEADKLSSKVEDSEKSVLQKVEDLFDRKFLGALGRIVACGTVMYGIAVSLQAQGLNKTVVGALAIAAGIAIWLIAQFLTKRK
jgi:hypothetical protein